MSHPAITQARRRVAKSRPTSQLLKTITGPVAHRAAGQLDLASLAQLAGGDIGAISGRQEWAENVVGRYV